MTNTVFNTTMGKLNLYWNGDRVDAHLADDGEYSFTDYGLPRPRSYRGDLTGRSLIIWAVIHSGLAEHFSKHPDDVERLVDVLTTERREYLVEKRLEVSSGRQDVGDYSSAREAWAIAELEQEEAELDEYVQNVHDHVTPSTASRNLLRLIETLPAIPDAVTVTHRGKRFTIYPYVLGHISMSTGQQRVRTDLGSFSIQGSATVDALGHVTVENVYEGGLRASDNVDRKRINDICREILSEVVKDRLSEDGTFQNIVAWMAAKKTLVEAARGVVRTLSGKMPDTDAKSSYVDLDCGSMLIEELTSGRFVLRGQIPNLDLEVTRESGTNAIVQEFVVQCAVTADGHHAINRATVLLEGNKNPTQSNAISTQVGMLAYDAFCKFLQDRASALPVPSPSR